MSEAQTTNDLPICPRCGKLMFGPDEWDMDDGDEEYLECGQCGESSWVKCVMSVRVSYMTTAGADDEEAKSAS